MAVNTPREFIEEVLPDKLSDPEKLKDIDASVQLVIAGEEGGEWYLLIKDQKVEVQKSALDDPKITIRMKDKDFVKLVNGELSGQRAFMTGKLKFKGDMSLGIKLQRLNII